MTRVEHSNIFTSHKSVPLITKIKLYQSIRRPNYKPVKVEVDLY